MDLVAHGSVWTQSMCPAGATCQIPAGLSTSPPTQKLGDKDSRREGHRATGRTLVALSPYESQG